MPVQTYDKILTARPVPNIPPANVHVPHIPNIVALCCSVYQDDSALTQFGQQVACINKARNRLSLVAYVNFM